jgi:hypothetical protein
VRQSGRCLPGPATAPPGFFVEPSRCWAFVYDHNLQGTHCREVPTHTGRWHSPRGDGQWWRVWSCNAHIPCLTAAREFGRRQPS